MYKLIDGVDSVLPTLSSTKCQNLTSVLGDLSCSFSLFQCHVYKANSLGIPNSSIISITKFLSTLLQYFTKSIYYYEYSHFVYGVDCADIGYMRKNLLISISWIIPVARFWNKHGLIKSWFTKKTLGPYCWAYSCSVSMCTYLKTKRRNSAL